MESLANKLRPISWAEIVSQPVTVSVLSKQCATGTFKHAYIFAGQSGCGKTSAARIMCNQLNECETKADELDGTKNASMEDIRSLIDSVSRISLDKKYRVVIIDECHNFSQKGWDTFLKTIEEPPSHVIFVFCTTEPNRIPKTVQTRCQRFDFYKSPIEDIYSHLAFICNEKLNVKFEDSGLKLIADKADGSVREAVKLLEQCLDYGDLTIKNIELVLNIFSQADLWNLLKAFETKDKEKGLELLNKIILKTNVAKVFDQLLHLLLNIQKFYMTKKIIYTTFTRVPEITIDANKYIEQLMNLRNLIDESNAKLLFEHFVMGALNE